MSSYADKTYIVFLDLPLKIAVKIDRIRSRYSDGFKKYPAHITLKQDEDFLVTGDQIGQIVETQIKDQQALKVRLKRPVIIRNKIGWNIYLPIESDDLQQRVRRISRALENFIDPDSPRAFLSTKWEQSSDFYAHVSIKGGGLETDPTDLLARIQKEDFDIDFSKEIVCNTITVANWQTDRWQQIGSFKMNL